VRAGSTSHDRRHAERGATAVEFAVVFPLLAAVMFGVIDGGRLVASRVMLTYAVSQGTRVAALSSTTSQSEIDAAIRGHAPMLTTMTIDPVACTSPCAGGFGAKTTGDRIAVTARYTFSPAFFSSFARTLTQTSWVVVE
jgi:Flp pilus assembly protein TadG